MSGIPWFRPTRTRPTLRLARIVLLAGVALLVLAGVAGAQERPGRGRDTDAMLDRMTKRLSLSEEQQQQIRAIYQKREVEAREMMRKVKESGASQVDRRQQVMAFRQQTQDQVEAVLDEKQVEEYRKMRAQRRDAMSKRRAQGAGPGRARMGPGGGPKRRAKPKAAPDAAPEEAAPPETPEAE